MKKRMMMAVCCLGMALFLMGCASQTPHGFILIDNTLPMQVGDSTVNPVKKGTATSTSILWLVASGDSSLEAACKNGGITKISHADWKVRNILGVIGEYTTTVYGE